ncbi:MAG: hypothetical protein IT427_12165 [Pirellulales bacterium]|nr:hypothetical protein [Pirellulales bacterium]
MATEHGETEAAKQFDLGLTTFGDTAQVICRSGPPHLERRVTPIVSVCHQLDRELRDLAVQGNIKTSEGTKRLSAAIESQVLDRQIVKQWLRQKLLIYAVAEIKEQAQRVFKNQ